MFIRSYFLNSDNHKIEIDISGLLTCNCFVKTYDERYAKTFVL